MAEKTGIDHTQGQQPARILGERNRSDSPPQKRKKPDVPQSAVQKLNTECESTQEQKPTPEKATLTFKWIGKAESSTRINAIPHEGINELKKSVILRKQYEESKYHNATITPSAPRGAHWTLVPNQPKLQKENLKITVTPPYNTGSGSLFIKVNQKGRTKGDAVRIILHNNKQGSNVNTPLTVFGCGEETIEEALRNDKRFKDINVLYLLGTKLDKYEGTMRLSQLSRDDTYTIIVHDDSDNTDTEKYRITWRGYTVPFLSPH